MSTENYMATFFSPPVRSLVCGNRFEREQLSCFCFFRGDISVGNQMMLYPKAFGICSKMPGEK